jgi:hypothetical protein
LSQQVLENANNATAVEAMQEQVAVLDVVLKDVPESRPCVQGLVPVSFEHLSTTLKSMARDVLEHQIQSAVDVDESSSVSEAQEVQCTVCTTMAVWNYMLYIVKVRYSHAAHCKLIAP